MSTPLNVGMIGYGFMGRAHSNAYCQVNHFFDLEYRPVLKAVCARSADKAKVRDAIENRHGYLGTGGVVNMSATDHMGLDLSAFRMLEVRNGNWALVK